MCVNRQLRGCIPIEYGHGRRGEEVETEREREREREKGKEETDEAIMEQGLSLTMKYMRHPADDAMRMHRTDGTDGMSGMSGGTGGMSHTSHTSHTRGMSLGCSPDGSSAIYIAKRLSLYVCPVDEECYTRCQIFDEAEFESGYDLRGNSFACATLLEIATLSTYRLRESVARADGEEDIRRRSESRPDSTALVAKTSTSTAQPVKWRASPLSLTKLVWRWSRMPGNSFVDTFLVFYGWARFATRVAYWLIASIMASVLTVTIVYGVNTYRWVHVSLLRPAFHARDRARPHVGAVLRAITASLASMFTTRDPTDVDTPTGAVPVPLRVEASHQKNVHVNVNDAYVNADADADTDSDSDSADPSFCENDEDSTDDNDDDNDIDIDIDIDEEVDEELESCLQEMIDMGLSTADFGRCRRARPTG